MTDTRMPAGQRAAASRLGATLVVNASTATTPFSAMPAATTTTPATQAIPIGDCPLVHLVFGLKAAVTKSFNYRVIGWHNLSVTRGVPLWVPKLLASGAATAASGSTAITGVATGFFADTITETLRNPGSIVTPETPDNSVAVLTLDTKNSLIVTIETDLADATHAYVWSIPGESSGGGMADITVTGLGLATSALQTALNTLLAVGSGAMASAQAVTLATDDTQFGTVGAAADDDGNIHGQLRFANNYLVTVDAVLDNLYASQSPPAIHGLAVVTIDGGWDSIALSANTVFVDFMLTGVACRVICADSAPTTTTGCIYQPNIVYRIPARGMTNIYAERTTAVAGTLNVTCYCTA